VDSCGRRHSPENRTISSMSGLASQCVWSAALPNCAIFDQEWQRYARVDRPDSKGLNEHERMAIELAEERSRLSAS